MLMWLSLRQVALRWNTNHRTARRTLDHAGIEIVRWGKAQSRVRLADIERFEQGEAGADVVERLARAIRAPRVP